MNDLKSLAEAHLGINLPDAALETFEVYTAQIIEWNQRINLTSIVDGDEIRIKHFLDSLSILTLPDLPDEARVIDVGTGAGLPGLALKIVRPAWQVTLLDATSKKTDFLNHAIEQLGLEGVSAVHMRAEDAGHHADYREQFDVVVARAVARLPTLAEFLLPLCQVGGMCVAMKGDTAGAEVEDAAHAMEILGGRLGGIYPVQLPHVEQGHMLVCLRKTAPTPPKYPRRVGVPAKKPL